MDDWSLHASEVAGSNPGVVLYFYHSVHKVNRIMCEECVPVDKAHGHNCRVSIFPAIGRVVIIEP